MGKINGSTGAFCDKCYTYLPPFQKIVVEERRYSPGPRHAVVSSDITNKTNRLIDLCPQCEEKFRNVIEEFLKRK